VRGDELVLFGDPESVRVCPACGQLLPVRCFGLHRTRFVLAHRTHGTRKDGRRTMCRDCEREGRLVGARRASS
jgi:hypothetical protein